MFKRSFCLIMVMVLIMMFSVASSTYTQSETNEPSDSTVSNVYSILSQEDIDNGVVRHDIIIMDNGAYCESKLILVDSFEGTAPELADTLDEPESAISNALDEPN